MGNGLPEHEPHACNNAAANSVTKEGRPDLSLYDDRQRLQLWGQCRIYTDFPFQIHRLQRGAFTITTSKVENPF